MSRRLAELTDRERQVLILIAKGHTSQQAADKLQISRRTIEAHRVRVCSKLQANGTAQLTQAAIVLGLITPQMPAEQR